MQKWTVHSADDEAGCFRCFCSELSASDGPYSVEILGRGLCRRAAEQPVGDLFRGCFPPFRVPAVIAKVALPAPALGEATFSISHAATIS
jgi:hypothetical protein